LKDGTELVWELIKDNFEQARSHEEYREKTVSLTLTVASIFIAALAIDGFAAKTVSLLGHNVTFQRLDGICLVVIGIFGALCSQKHYERNRMHVALAQEYLKKLAETENGMFPFDVSKAFTDFEKTKKWKAAWAEPIKLNLLWTGFPLIVAIVGIILAFSS
jgi:hypothetical protein